MAAERRLEKLERELVRELSKIILYELNDPRMGFVTVMRTKITPDLKQAKVFLSIMGEEKAKKLTFHGLHHARGFIQKTLSGRLGRLRFAPELIFAMDDSIDKAFRLSGVFKQLDQERRLRKPAPEDEPSSKDEDREEE